MQEARGPPVGTRGFIDRIPVAMSEGSHPFPSRTRKLSPPEPMVLRGKPRGRVGRCRIFFCRRAPASPLTGWSGGSSFVRASASGVRLELPRPTAWPLLRAPAPRRGKPRDFKGKGRRSGLTRLSCPSKVHPTVPCTGPSPSPSLADARNEETLRLRQVPPA
jgi:hypothetical protein